MGFDLYGLNPKLKGVKPSIDWNTATDKDKDNYVKALNIFEEENPGYYFRNNVWWWRPLAYLIEDFIDLHPNFCMTIWELNNSKLKRLLLRLGLTTKKFSRKPESNWLNRK